MILNEIGWIAAQCFNPNTKLDNIEASFANLHFGYIGTIAPEAQCQICL